MKLKYIIHFFILIFLYFSQLSFGSRTYWSFEKAIKRSPVLIEGVVVDIPPSYFANRNIYTSRIVKVLKVFKGELKAKYIEIPLEGGTVGNITSSIASCGTLHLPGKGARAIFCLNNTNPKDSTRNKKYKASGKNLANNFIVHPYYDAFAIDLKKNIEIEYYQKIEKLTGIKRKIIQKFNTNDAKGIEVVIDKILPAKNGEYIDVWIKASSINKEIYYLETLSFDVEYSSKVFRKKIVKKNRVQVNKRFNKYKQNIRYVTPALLAGDSIYDVKFTDKSKSILNINISHKNKSKYFQISSNYINVIRLKAHKMEGELNINIIDSSIQGSHYNYSNDKTFPFDNCITKNFNSGDMSYYQLPQIISHFPDTVTANLDTLTIYGNHLLSNNTDVLIWTKKQGCGFHKAVPKENIIFHSKNKIVLTIPSLFTKGNSACGRGFYPVSGFIISKRDIFESTESSKRLIIKLP